MSRRRACVIGHPVAQARSPVLHRHWLKEYGIDGDYTREDVLPDQINSFLKNLRTHGYVGANITVPHKAAAYHALDHAEPVVETLKVTNTIWLKDDGLHGTNTDVSGFLANLDEVVPDWNIDAEQAVVLGAGGGARAVVYGLLSRGLKRVVVVNRTLARAQAFTVEFGNRVTAASYFELAAWLKDADVLVNTTSLGMAGQPPLDIDISPLAEDGVVYDIVYVPLETPLLAAARARKLRTVDGLGMLLHQAVPAFEKFFGIRPKVTSALREAVLTDIAKGQAK
ncbi:MAG TPA: shikimate dehydrogenase [Xanthobacteraceae bacterium]|nr:shikimate dehydrogenase [Xanthobacteraceae bacterium]